MRVFMCEFVTGGGMRDRSLPPSLAREGMMMRDALARDLIELPGVTLVTTHDDRLPPPPPGAASIAVGKGRDPWKLWRYCAGKSNAAWAVAPESGGVLERLTELCVDAGARIIGPDAAAVRVASSKRATAERLIEKGVPALPVWTPGAAPKDAHGPVVSKPDDGAGCDATLFWSETPPPSALPGDHVVQRFEAGEALSITVLRENGKTTLLSANRQRVEIDNGVFAFRGLTVAALNDEDGRLASIAEGVTAALPGLDGIFGVDLVLGEGGPTVVEVNPRITTAYVGLREALGRNPASLVAPFATSGGQRPPLAGRPVEIAL